MTAQTDTLAGGVRPAPTAATPTAAQLAADLERARDAARAVPSPETLAAHRAAFAAAHGAALRARARRDLLHALLGALAVAAVIAAAAAGMALLSPGDRQTVAGTGVLVIVGAFVAGSILAARNVRPAPPAPPPAPSPCICGNTPTLHHLRGAATGEYWLYTCAPPCDDALCAHGDTLAAARQTWESVVSEARRTQ